MASACRLNVRLKPQAKRNAVSADSEGTVTIAVSSPPIDGKANAHAIKLLSQTLNVPKSACTILRGQSSRNKVIAIEGVDKDSAMKRIAQR